jgi:exonuclease VII small subunit
MSTKKNVLSELKGLGQELAAACAKQLDEAELKLRQLQPES